MPTDTTTQDITEEIRGLFRYADRHFADKSARWLSLSPDSFQEIRNGT